MVIASLENRNNCNMSRELLPLVKEDSPHPSLDIKLTFTNFLQMSELMRSESWEDVTTQNDPNKAIDMFYSKIYQIFDECVPTYKLYNYNKFPKWFTPKIKNC